MPRSVLIVGLALLLAGVFGPAAFGQVKLPERLFSDNMVLQRDMEAPVWGQAQPGEKVTVTIAGRSVEAVAAADGKWMARLAPLAAGGPFELKVAADSGTVTLANVMVGEVWLCSGQSNMQFGLGSAAEGPDAIASADLPSVRFCPYSGGKSWTVCSPATARNCSAVAFFFARELHKALGVPVGVIVSAVGGTAAQQWMSPRAFREDAWVKKNFTDPMDRFVADYPKRLADWRQRMRELGKEPSERAPDRPPDPADWTDHPGRMPTGMYMRNIRPLIPFAIRGVLWYHGESNAWAFEVAQQYYGLLPALVRDWRARWGRDDLPFLIVQLPDIRLGFHAKWFGLYDDELELSQWDLVQEAQARAAGMPNAGLVVGLDVGDKNDIHPKRKQTVGERSALMARKLAYGEKDLQAFGPAYESMTVEGDKLRLRFSETAGGLADRDGGRLRGFVIAGPDRWFTTAQAKIDGDTVLVWSKKVAKPTAARYAFTNNTQFDLVNKVGLPAGPFRTDDWPWDTPARKARTARCARVAKPPAIDGRLDDSAWQQCTAAGEFTLPHCHRRSAYPTEVRLGYDAENLYVAFRCRQEEAPAVTAALGDRDDERIWLDDTVELMLDTNLDRRNYVRFVFNANGAVLDARGFNELAGGGPLYVDVNSGKAYRTFDKSWNASCTVKAGREDGAWCVEAAIPWKSLGLAAPKPGKKMGVQFARTHANPVEESEFITTGRDRLTATIIPACKYYHRPARFAALTFE